MCKKMSFSYTNFQKNLPTVGGGNPLPHPPHARSLRSLSPRFGPLLANLGCNTVTCIATCKGRRAHVSPYRTLPPLGRFAPSLWPPLLTNPGPHSPPPPHWLEWKKFNKGVGGGVCYTSFGLHYLPPSNGI